MTQFKTVRRRMGAIVVLLIVVAGAWAALWHYGAGAAERTLAGWLAREAQAGRIYNCASRTIGGFPFGIELRCAEPSAELTSNRPPLALKAAGILVSATVWQPTTLIADFAGPLTIAEPGQSAAVAVTWRQARTQVHGLPVSPERVSIAIEQPTAQRAGDRDRLFKSERLDLDGRLVAGTVRDNPVIEIALKLVAAAAPLWHPAAATPVDADITAVLRGLKDFAPKPWPQRFRELQAAGGRIEIVKARVQQQDTVAIANGTLGLTAAGRLNGELRLTVANLERLLPTLGLERLLSQEQASPQLNRTFEALDRFLPGLGNVARQNAGPAIVAGINLMGQPGELEGRRAVMLPLRFDDGMASLGPLRIGMTPPLF